uniref:Putative LAGLIDADG endonuclease n=1 Tax=Rhodotorula mucilaginosa TaxID=5537 RepID=A0A2D2LYR9_RHOMI|nr:putative LAGLIDADG endonuclease [Rhodotorula mucilaginosa]ATR80212.1 putative LAGLIDADG endonuclease [Rhodotorula mucilaginosa]
MTNNSLRSMFVGTLLGDAHIRRSSSTAYITFEQALAKKEYLMYLYNQVMSMGLALKPPVQYDRVDPRYNKTNSSLYFRTVATVELLDLANLFLDSLNNKVVPLNIAELLDLEALAYWISDDGQTVKRGGVTLCTDSFTPFEVQLLCDALMKNFGMVTTLHRKNLNHRIYISKHSLYEVRDQLKQLMHPSHWSKIHY